MSRTGLEEKIPWRAVKPEIRLRVAAALGSPVARASRVWGGYGPTPTFRLLLGDGRRVFFKGVNADSNEFARRSLAEEEKVYREAGDLIRGWTPPYLGSFHHGDWHVLLLEDLGPKTVPPWTPALARAIARSFADLHRRTLGATLSGWLPREPTPYGPAWEQIADESDGFARIVATVGTSATRAHRWLRDALPDLAHAAGTIIGPPHSLVHLDVRSDNLRLVNGRLYLFDLPNLAVGAPEYDLAEFAQTVTVEGGPSPEEVVAWYAQRLSPRDEALDAAVASLAGFFAHRFWQPEIPGLPRLRRFQRDQFRICLTWAARRLRLPEPDWIVDL